MSEGSKLDTYELARLKEAEAVNRVRLEAGQRSSVLDDELPRWKLLLLALIKPWGLFSVTKPSSNRKESPPSVVDFSMPSVYPTPEASPAADPYIFDMGASTQGVEFQADTSSPSAKIADLMGITLDGDEEGGADDTGPPPPDETVET